MAVRTKPPKNTIVIKSSGLFCKLFLIIIMFFHTDTYGGDIINEQKYPKNLIYSCPKRVFEQFYGPSTNNTPLGKETYLFNLFHINGRYMVTSNPLSHEYLLSTFGKMDIINDTIVLTPEISVYSDNKSGKTLNIRQIESLKADQKYEQELKMKGVRVDDNRIVLLIDMRQNISPVEWEAADSLARNGEPRFVNFFKALYDWTEEKTIYKLSSDYSIRLQM